MKDLEEVFKHSEKYNLKIKIEKCTFSVKTLTFQGHRISEKGLKPSTDNTKTILNYPQFQDYAGLRRII